jgi:hypothetical protein
MFDKANLPFFYLFTASLIKVGAILRLTWSELVQVDRYSRNRHLTMWFGEICT